MDLSEFRKGNRRNSSGSSSIIVFGVDPSGSDDRMLIGITSY
jgi:hypothetical protein